MTYAGYLALFLGLPLLVLLWLALHDWRRGAFSSPLGWLALGVHVIVAVLYTTPWDNYLVASDVWWYEPQRVTGIVLGWVPIEEYVFFVLQTLMTGTWLLWLLRRDTAQPWRRPASWRPWRPGMAAAVLAGAVWLLATATLLLRWLPGIYLALELFWFLPPIILQLIAGSDILWKQRRVVAVAILPPALFLAVTDALAIRAGVWTIDPAQTTGILIGGLLPVEELLFFTLTNILIVFGMSLVIMRAGKLTHE
jgi:lycopene beta-cyclase